MMRKNYPNNSIDTCGMFNRSIVQCVYCAHIILLAVIKMETGSVGTSIECHQNRNRWIVRLEFSHQSAPNDMSIMTECTKINIKKDNETAATPTDKDEKVNVSKKTTVRTFFFSATKKTHN